jgi:hypothetical protein
MKLGIIGLPATGKSTIFEALTQRVATGSKGETRMGTVRVPDHRLDFLNQLYQREKVIYAQVEYLLPGITSAKQERGREVQIWNQARDCDALIHVVRNFKVYGFEAPTPCEDFRKLDQELILADLLVVEKRLERMELDGKRGKKIDAEELSLLHDCLKNLENEVPLRKFADLTSAQQLKNYAFLSAKPTLVLFNNEDEDEALPDAGELTSTENCMVIRGKLEQELTQMSEEEVSELIHDLLAQGCPLPLCVDDQIAIGFTGVLQHIPYLREGAVYYPRLHVSPSLWQKETNRIVIVNAAEYESLPKCPDYRSERFFRLDDGTTSYVVSRTPTQKVVSTEPSLLDFTGNTPEDIAAQLRRTGWLFARDTIQLGFLADDETNVTAYFEKSVAEILEEQINTLATNPLYQSLFREHYYSLMSLEQQESTDWFTQTS